VAESCELNVGRGDWKSNLHAYGGKSAVEFESLAELNAFIDMVWTDTELRHMPRVHVGRNTVVVPTEAVPLLVERNLKFGTSLIRVAT